MGGNKALTAPDARLLYRLPGPTPDGRTVLLLSPLELLQRLARLVPPPRVHRHRYHGVLAPNARLRPRVMALREGEPDDGPPLAHDEIESSETLESHTTEGSPPSGRSTRIRWAQLLARIYEVLPLLCPGHRAKRGRGGPMRILAFLTDPPVVRSILVHLDPGHSRNARIAWDRVCPAGPLRSHPPAGLRWATFGSSPVPVPRFARCPRSHRARAHACIRFRPVGTGVRVRPVGARPVRLTETTDRPVDFLSYPRLPPRDPSGPPHPSKHHGDRFAHLLRRTPLSPAVGSRPHHGRPGGAFPAPSLSARKARPTLAFGP